MKRFRFELILLLVACIFVVWSLANRHPSKDEEYNRDQRIINHGITKYTYEDFHNPEISTPYDVEIKPGEKFSVTTNEGYPATFNTLKLKDGSTVVRTPYFVARMGNSDVSIIPRPATLNTIISRHVYLMTNKGKSKYIKPEDSK